MKTHVWFLAVALCVSACSGADNRNSNALNTNDAGLNAAADNKARDPLQAGLGKEDKVDGGGGPTDPAAQPNNPVTLNPGIIGTLNPTGGPGVTLNPAQLAAFLPHTLLIHSSDCAHQSSQGYSGPSGEDHYKTSSFLCPVKLPEGAQVKAITTYAPSFDLEDDPVAVGAIGLPAAGGSYTWKSSLQAKSVTLKADKSGYNTKLVPNCELKDWQYAVSLPAKRLTCEFTKKEDNLFYVSLESTLKTQDDTPKQLTSVPPVMNLIAVEYFGPAK